MPANLGNSAVATELEKVSFHSQSLRKAMPKNVQTIAQLHWSHTLVEKAMATHSNTLAWKIPWMEEPGRLQSMGCEESDTTKRLHFHFSLHALEKEMATHSSVLARRIPGTGEPGGLLSVGSHRVGHDWSDLAAAAAYARKVTLKILQARLQQYVNRELLDVQAGFRKGRGTRDRIANIRWIMEKAREFQKNIYFCLMTMPKPLTVWIPVNCGKFWKRWEYQTTWPSSWEFCMQVRKQQLQLDMEQQTGSK